MAQTLTKSRFLLGLGCPQKLVYAADKSFFNASNEDSFLRGLAQGGFQVGQFAKAHFPGGIEISTLDQAQALAETAELLERDSVVIFEAAVMHDNCFVRVDVLEKKQDRLVIHEVKAKSFDPGDSYLFVGRKGGIKSNMSGYLYDAAFQRYVVASAFPECNVTVNLMLVNKHATCSVGGLHQKFRLVREKGRTTAFQSGPLPTSLLEFNILVSIPVDSECDLICESNRHGSRFQGSFKQLVQHLSDVCAGLGTIKIEVKGDCGSCEFKSEEPSRSGWTQCLGKYGITDPKPGELIFDLWQYRKKDDLIDQGQLRLAQLHEEDLGDFDEIIKGPPLKPKQRQWLQIQKAKDRDDSPWVNEPGWREAMAEWTFPFHFIDFETTRVALPFFAGDSPYKSIAFQFSHHSMSSEGQIDHAD